jgi:type VI secretion system protein ImpE
MAIMEKNPPPPISGTLNGKPFDSLCDCDDVLAPILEVATNQGYFWVPLSSVVSFTSVGPKFPRDLYWLPGNLELADGQNGPAFLPSLYVDSYKHTDDAVKLGRMTDWIGGDGEPVRGRGQKTLLAGEEVIGLLDLRELEIQHA